MISFKELFLILLVIGGFYLYKRYSNRIVNEASLEKKSIDQLSDKGKLLKQSHPVIRSILNHLHDLNNSSIKKYQQFTVLEPGINAMAFPAGTILLTEEFIREINNDTFTEDEIAAILAHEIGHIELGHAKERIIEKYRHQAAQVALNIASSNPLLRYGAKTLSALLQQKYSREQELEADSYAFNLLSHSRYQSQGTISALMKFKGFENSPKWAVLFSTHPSIDERIAKLEALNNAV
jgi:Zn-dependent protease with chaperone function